MPAKRVGVLVGGPGPEREISLKSGDAIVSALKHLGYEVCTIEADADLAYSLRSSSIDVAFLALHGVYGEDGCVQGLLELMGIPYTGSSLLASALAMSKLKSKELFRLYNIPTSPFYTVTESQLAKLKSLHGLFGFPVFVKPDRSGSSLGTAAAYNLSELEQALRAALAFDSTAVVERFIKGREVTVAVLDGKALGALEIEARTGVYDYDSKYTEGASDYFYPARVSKERYQCLLHLAERAHASLGASGATRVDMLITEGENEYVLEVNTLPGMTEYSLLPMIAEHSGYAFPALCEAILQRASLSYPSSALAQGAGLAGSSIAKAVNL